MYIIDGQQLLDFQPSLLRLHQETFKSVVPIFLVFYFIYGIGLVTFLTLCFRSLKKYSSNFSAKVWKNHKMLFKSICFQFLTMLFMVVIPLLIFVTILSINSSSNYIYYVIITLIWTFPAIDNIVTVVTIAPYRRFIMRNFIRFRSSSTPQIHVR